MPIYEYRCKECGELHEALQKVNDPLLTACPACGKESLQKKVSAAAFRLKGSGWYETDFKAKNQKNLAGDNSKDGASGGSEGASAKADKAGTGDAAKKTTKADTSSNTGGSNA